MFRYPSMHGCHAQVRAGMSAPRDLPGSCAHARADLGMAPGMAPGFILLGFAED
jgi:hypothetical protein